MYIIIIIIIIYYYYYYYYYYNNKMILEYCHKIKKNYIQLITLVYKKNPANFTFLIFMVLILFTLRTALELQEAEKIDFYSFLFLNNVCRA